METRNGVALRWLRRCAALAGSVLALAILYLLAAALWPLALPAPAPADDRLLLRGVHVIDLDAGSAGPPTDVLIAQGRIAQIGSLSAALATRVIDARGQYVIPGLFDMHAHSLRLAPWLAHPLFVAAGVTAIRDMGGCLGDRDSWVACAPDKRRWHSAVEDGSLVGPRYDRITSLAINGGSEVPASMPAELGAPTAEAARRRVAHDSARGIDFLKTYNLLPREAYFALASAATAADMEFAGHLPLAVSAHEAVAAGQRSFEHAFLFITECFPDMAALRELGSARAIYTHEMRERMIDEHDPALCDALFRVMAEAGTAFVPTHTTRKLDAYARDEVFLNDPRLRYIPGPLRMLWRADAESMASRTSEAGLESYRRFYRFGIELTGRAHAAGVLVLAGTDAPDSYAFPGFGLHDELLHLEAAGLSPLQALRSATVDAAGFLGLEGEAGVVSPGARADLVLLADNPLRGLAALNSIDSVILAGRLYDRPALDRLLRSAEDAAGHWSMWGKFLWQGIRSPILRAQAAD